LSPIKQNEDTIIIVKHSTIVKSNLEP